MIKKSEISYSKSKRAERQTQITNHPSFVFFFFSSTLSHRPPVGVFLYDYTNTTSFSTSLVIVFCSQANNKTGGEERDSQTHKQTREKRKPNNATRRQPQSLAKKRSSFRGLNEKD
jgi:hypothetical protein